MNKIYDRIKNILFHPKQEWHIIRYEHVTTGEILLQYALPLIGLSAIATFVGYSLFGFNDEFVKTGQNIGITLAVNRIISDFALILSGAYIIDWLAPYFGAEKDRKKSLQLITYSYTPVMIGGILHIIPLIAFVGSVFGLYGIVLLYLGMTPMKSVSKDKTTAYFIVSIIILLIVNILIGYLLNGLFGNPYHLP